MFSTKKFLSSLAKGRYKRVLYYPSAGERDGGFVCDFDTDIIILSDFRPKTIRDRRTFWRQFRQGAAPHEIRLIAATRISRVFRINRRKIGIFLFKENNEAITMIRNSGLKINTFFSKNDGCCEGGNLECCNELPFFSKILNLMPDDGGMYVISDHNTFLFTGSYHGNTMKDRDFRFVIGNTAYETSLISHREGRMPEFIIKKKCQVNEVKRYDPVSSPTVRGQ